MQKDNNLKIIGTATTENVPSAIRRLSIPSLVGVSLMQTSPLFIAYGCKIWRAARLPATVIWPEVQKDERRHGVANQLFV